MEGRRQPFGHSFLTHIQGRALPVQAEGSPPAAFISLFSSCKTQVQRAARLGAEQLLSSQGFILWRNQRSLQPAASSLSALLLTPENLGLISFSAAL